MLILQLMEMMAEAVQVNTLILIDSGVDGNDGVNDLDLYLNEKRSR